MGFFSRKTKKSAKKSAARKAKPAAKRKVKAKPKAKHAAARKVVRKAASVKAAKTRAVHKAAAAKEARKAAKKAAKRAPLRTRVEAKEAKAKAAKPAVPVVVLKKVPPEIGEIKFKIENIVASANLEVELDLYGIAREVENVEYEPEQFPGAILKLKDPKTSLLLFKNGKLICTGAKSAEEVEKAINKAYSLIRDCIRT